MKVTKGSPCDCGRMSRCPMCRSWYFNTALRTRLKGPETPPLPPGKWLDLPPLPPPPAITPQSTRAVVTVSFGADGDALGAVTGHHLREYARHCGADMIVLDWPGHPDFPMSAKWAAGVVFQLGYDAIIYADRDVLFRPGAVNLFDLCPTGFGAVDELATHIRDTDHHVLTYRINLRARGVEPGPEWSPDVYLNLGVYVCHKDMADVLTPPSRVWVPDSNPGKHCAEQDWVNWNLSEAKATGRPVHVLPESANTQNWSRPGFVGASPDAVLHWSSAASTRAHRAEMIRRTAVLYPWPTPAPAPEPMPLPPVFSDYRDPEWATDLRHVRWIRDTLLSGRFRRVLEIGTFQGFSACTLLDAAKAGRVDRVDLCDPNPTPELDAVLAHYGLGDRVTVHRCTSPELFSKGWGGWDLVFVDGDHTFAAVRKEVPVLLSNTVRAVFAHDTHAIAAGYPECDGPPYLASEFANAGYQTAEDSLKRAGERTDRGMFFAARSPADYAAGVSALLAHTATVTPGPLVYYGPPTFPPDPLPPMNRPPAHTTTGRTLTRNGVRVLPAPTTGWGTELRKLLADLGLTPSSGCECESRVDKMNRGEASREEVEAWLREESRKVGWVRKLKAGALSVASGLAINPLDPITGIVDEALRRSSPISVPSLPTEVT